MILATRTVEIERPLDEVCRQFADVAHHERAAPHRNTRFSVLHEAPEHCDYEQVSRSGPVTIRQRFHLDRADLHHQVNTVTAGPFRGGSLEFTIREDRPGSTAVTATLHAAGRLHRITQPLLRPVFGRALGRALAEDKRDLESGNYGLASV